MRIGKLISMLAVSCALLAFAIPASSAGFSKSESYRSGMFIDVSADQWYAPSVAEVYEFGIMQGDSDVTFNPDGTLSVAEGITIASRIYEIISQNAIPEADGAWYQKYVNYALSSGLVKEGDFDSYERTIRRFEMARLLAAAGKSTFENINTVDSLPDVSAENPDSESIFQLYRAGILTGNDDYGTFNASGFLKRSEMSAMAVRIADNNQRLAKTFLKASPRTFTDSYSLIDSPATYANSASAQKEAVPNGWNGDNRFLLSFRLNDTARFLQMNDSDADKFYALNRDFSSENDGVVTAELLILAKGSDDGIYVSVQNENEQDVATLTPKNGVWTLEGANTASSDVNVSATGAVTYSVVLTIDLDKNTASAVINNRSAGSVFISDESINRLKIGTTKEGFGSVSLDYARMWKNKPINEHFLAPDSCDGQSPSGWEVSGSFALAKMASNKGNEIFSMRSETKGGASSSASTSFEALSGSFSAEAYVLFPKITDGAKMSFTSGGKDVLTFETKNGKLYYGDVVVNDYYG